VESAEPESSLAQRLELPAASPEESVDAELARAPSAACASACATLGGPRQRTPRRPRGGVEWALLDLLLEEGDRTWGIGELVDEVGSPIAVAEALQALQAAGLIEHTGALIRIAPA
jgi:hypothetical protein